MSDLRADIVAEVKSLLGGGGFVPEYYEQIASGFVDIAERYQPRWIPVSERLPEMKEAYRGGPKSVRVLVFSGHYVCEGKLEETYVRRTVVWKSALGRGIHVTHWMPLPDPPAKEVPDGN